MIDVPVFTELNDREEMILRYLAHFPDEHVPVREVNNVVGSMLGHTMHRMARRGLCHWKPGQVMTRTGPRNSIDYQITTKGLDALTYYGKD